MSKNFYIPFLTFKDTVLYINNFQNKLIDEFKIRYGEMISIDLPLICNIKSDNNKLLNNIRTIDFDSTYDFSIYQFIYTYDSLIRYFFYNIVPSGNEFLFFKYSEIDRDKNTSDKSDIETLIWNLEFKIVEENRNHKYIANFAENIWKSIYKTYLLSKRKIRNVKEKIEISSFDKLDKLYPLSSINNSIKNYVKEKNLVGLITNKKHFSEFYKNRFANNYDMNNTISVFAWNEYTKNIQELICITVRPNWYVFKEQTHIDVENTPLFNNELYTIIKKDNMGVSLSCKIYFDNLMQYLLGKNSLEELPSKTRNFDISKIYRIKNLNEK